MESTYMAAMSAGRGGKAVMSANLARTAVRYGGKL